MHTPTECIRSWGGFRLPPSTRKSIGLKLGPVRTVITVGIAHPRRFPLALRYISLSLDRSRSCSSFNAASSLEQSRHIRISPAIFLWACRRSRRVTSNSEHSKSHWCLSNSSREGIPSSNPLSSIKSFSITHSPSAVYTCSVRLGDGVQYVCDGWPALSDR